MPKTPPGKIRIHIYMGEKLFRAFDNYREATGLKTSSAVERLTARALDPAPGYDHLHEIAPKIKWTQAADTTTVPQGNGRRFHIEIPIELEKKIKAYAETTRSESFSGAIQNLVYVALVADKGVRAKQRKFIRSVLGSKGSSDPQP